MNTPLRVIVGILGAFFLLQGAGWLFAPASAAEGLGMPLLDGVGRSTQIGDMGAFFLGLGTFILLGAIRRERPWLLAGAILLGGAAVVRSLSTVFHGAPFATQFIAIEAIIAALLVFAATRRSEEV
ncbi:MAG: hypothetical protein CL910_08810 [Deltaproteobacteria bacterium]|jgi:hypothetical protein|nr:hypothetical protein [Deltaproteobacteria bacterium]